MEKAQGRRLKISAGADEFSPRRATPGLESGACICHCHKMGQVAGGRVLVIDRVHRALIEELEARGLRVVYRPGMGRRELLEALEEYEVLVLRGRLRVDEEVLERGSRLRVVARAGTGLDNIDLRAAAARGVKVVNAPEGAVESVAELAIGLMICAARMMPQLCWSVKQGSWERPLGVELAGKTLAIVGLGRIGARVAALARCLGMRVVAYDKRDVSRRCALLGAEAAASLHEALSRADVISLHVPLTPETYHMISWREFEVLRRGVILVNTSRGAVVDPEALLWALEAEVVGAAALDVLSEEPPRSRVVRKLVQHPRVIVTPHIGAQTREAQERVARILARRILAALGLLGESLKPVDHQCG